MQQAPLQATGRWDQLPMLQAQPSHNRYRISFQPRNGGAAAAAAAKAAESGELLPDRSLDRSGAVSHSISFTMARYAATGRVSVTDPPLQSLPLQLTLQQAARMSLQQELTAQGEAAARRLRSAAGGGIGTGAAGAAEVDLEAVIRSNPGEAQARVIVARGSWELEARRQTAWKGKGNQRGTGSGAAAGAVGTGASDAGSSTSMSKPTDSAAAAAAAPPGALGLRVAAARVLAIHFGAPIAAPCVHGILRERQPGVARIISAAGGAGAGNESDGGGMGSAEAEGLAAAAEDAGTAAAAASTEGGDAAADAGPADEAAGGIAAPHASKHFATGAAAASTAGVADNQGAAGTAEASKAASTVLVPTLLAAPVVPADAPLADYWRAHGFTYTAEAAAAVRQVTIAFGAFTFNASQPRAALAASFTGGSASSASMNGASIRQAALRLGAPIVCVPADKIFRAAAPLYLPPPSHAADAGGRFPWSSPLRLSLRAALRARPGYVIIAADFRQMEARLLAHLSRDAAMIAAFTGSASPGFSAADGGGRQAVVAGDGTDDSSGGGGGSGVGAAAMTADGPVAAAAPHAPAPAPAPPAQGDFFRRIASRWLRVPEPSITPPQRDAAKVMVYALVYGAGKHAIAAQMRVSLEEAARRVADFKTAFPGVVAWIAATQRQVAALGYATTLFGRRRYLLGARSSSSSTSSGIGRHVGSEDADRAARQGVNTTVQGSAADVLKRCLARINGAFAVELPQLLEQRRAELAAQAQEAAAAAASTGAAAGASSHGAEAAVARAGMAVDDAAAASGLAAAATADAAATSAVAAPAPRAQAVVVPAHPSAAASSPVPVVVPAHPISGLPLLKAFAAAETASTGAASSRAAAPGRGAGAPAAAASGDTTAEWASFVGGLGAEANKGTRGAPQAEALEPASHAAASSAGSAAATSAGASAPTHGTALTFRAPGLLLDPHAAGRVLLQIHDEVIAEVRLEVAWEAACIVDRCMRRAVKLLAPLDVEVSVGPSWGDTVKVPRCVMASRASFEAWLGIKIAFPIQQVR